MKATIVVGKGDLFEKSLKEILMNHGLNVEVDRILELKSGKDGEIAIKVK